MFLSSLISSFSDTLSITLPSLISSFPIFLFPFGVISLQRPFVPLSLFYVIPLSISFPLLLPTYLPSRTTTRHFREGNTLLAALHVLTNAELHFLLQSGWRRSAPASNRFHKTCYHLLHGYSENFGFRKFVFCRNVHSLFEMCARFLWCVRTTSG